MRESARETKEKLIKKFPEIINQFFKKQFLWMLIGLTIVLLIALITSILFTFKDPSKYLPPLIFSTAAFIAMLTYWREHNKTIEENNQSSSELFLKLASDGLTTVYELLKDKNNNNIIWIRAARTLLESQKLSEEIKSEKFLRAYRIHEEKVRNDLYLKLRTDTDNPQPLPPQFFFGTKDWKSGKDLDELAKETSQKFPSYNIDINSVPPEPPLDPISEKSVCAIYDFLEYPDPEDYLKKDLLQKVELWKEGYDHIIGPHSGAARYIYHRKTWHAVNGELFKRKPIEKPSK